MNRERALEGKCEKLSQKPQSNVIVGEEAQP